MNGLEQHENAASPILYHDGCNLCLDIARTLSGTMPGLRIVDLGLQPALASEAAALGVIELPSLVVRGKILPVAPHSRVDDH